MPTLLGAAVLALGGMVVWRVVRREWTRVNTNLDEQRSAPKQAEAAQQLEKDPETGTYRPKSD